MFFISRGQFLCSHMNMDFGTVSGSFNALCPEYKNNNEKMVHN